VRAPLDLLRFWFTFEERVDRRTYLVHGLALMAVKYVFDALFMWLALGDFWSPIDYLRTGIARADRVPGASTAFLVALGIWTLPFLWIGITMTVRRAIDAGLSAWTSLFFFVPWLNYVFMLMLSALPTNTTPAAFAPPADAPRSYEARLPSAMLSIGAGMGIGLAMIGIGVFALNGYGLALFVGTPFVMGAVTAFLFNRRYPATRKETHEVTLLMLAFFGGLAMLFAIEGLLCLAMAAPLAICLAIMGAWLGRWIAARPPESPRHAMLGMLALPLSAVLGGTAPAPTVHEVLSVIEIDAPPEIVWKYIVEFPPLAPPTELVFRSGIAYPLRAHIEGTGVGAVRHCVFSTGTFVEPITVWEPGRRLAFDVAEQPAPLTEWSPWDNLAPPHLNGFFRTRRGEFKLIPLGDGRTRLEGRTWYEVDIAPAGYWMAFADAFTSRIHGRVLMHIGRLAEAEYEPLRRDAR
jgi:uncharacterized membrane protein YhaH (DUF805 family)